MVRAESDDWNPHGARITSEENMAKMRAAADDMGIIVKHWFYRGARSPDLLTFTDSENFEEYMKTQVGPGDDFDVYSFGEIIESLRPIASGKFPDVDGCVPRRGAY